MNAGFRTQPAEGMVAGDLHRGPFDAGHLAGRHLGDLRGEAPLLHPAEVHAQEHLGPVLGFRTSGARLNLQVSVRRIHLTLEHPPEFQTRKVCFETGKFRGDLAEGILVVFLRGKLRKFSEVVEAFAQGGQHPDDGIEICPFFVQRLRALLVVPDRGIGEFEINLFQAMLTAFEVKDTP